MNLEALAREAGFLVEHDGCILIRGRDASWLLNGALTRFAALIRAQADAEATERLSIIADELIAGLGEPGRGLAEMIREGATALESHAAYVVRDVRAQALEEAAQAAEAAGFAACDSFGDGAECIATGERCAEAVRALKDKQ